MEHPDHIDIPANALVHCPKVKFALARMNKCVECEHFAGLNDRFPDGSVAFSKRFMLLCKHDPIQREIKEFAE